MASRLGLAPCFSALSATSIDCGGTANLAACDHRDVRQPSRPVPDWTGVCPDCGERVKHNGRGGFVTVREVNDHLAREQEAVNAFRRRWQSENQL